MSCIQVSQETGKVGLVFPSLSVFSTVCCDPHNGFSIVNEAEVNIFGESLVFSIIWWMLAISSLVPLSFLNPACTSRSSWFKYC